jgi:regulatory protein NPR1
LGEIAGQASIENVMRMLAASHKQEETHLWTLCLNLVGKSGLMIEQIRRKTGFGYGGSLSTGAITENRTSRMQKALDSSDVELVKLMVTGEGLDLDVALGLHYAVEKCSM